MSAPESTFYVTGGTLRQDAACYVERQADKDLLEGLLRGEFCYVLTSRQMGKSSLMVRTARKLREQGVQVVVLDLTAIGQNLTPEQWFDGLLVRLGRQLDLEDELEEFWEAHRQLGPCQRLFAALRDVVIGNAKLKTQNKSAGRLVIFVDELDVVRSLPFSTDEFFAAIRECYNRRTEDAEFNRLTFCLLGVATPSDLIRDTRTTPFNIGRRIVLNDFTPGEAMSLAQGLGSQPSTLNSQHLLERILHWTNGHPYLTQRLCQLLAQEGAATPRLSSASALVVDQVCASLFLSNRAREQDDNLLFVRERLLHGDADIASLLHLYGQVLTRWPRVNDDESNRLVSALRLTGIVKAAEGRLVVRNRIYAQVFGPSWVRSQMPDAEVRRQKAAFRLGVVRATAVAVLAVGAFVALAMFAFREARLAREARSQMERANLRLELERAELLFGQGRSANALASLARVLRADPSNHVVAERLVSALSLRNFCVPAAPPLRLDARFTAAEFSADGSRLLAISTNLQAWVLDARSGQPLAGPFPRQGRIRGAEISPDGQRVVTAGPNRIARVWDVSTGQPGGPMEHEQPVSFARFSPDGQQIVTLAGRELRVWDALSGQLRRGMITVNASVTSADISPDGQRVLATASGLTARIFDLESGQPSRSVFRQPRRLTTMRFSPDGQRVATAAKDSTARLWDASSGKPLGLPLRHDQYVQGVEFSPDGLSVVTASTDNTVRMWDAHTGEPVTEPIKHEQEVTSTRMSADGQRIFSVSKSLWVWNVRQAQPLAQVFAHADEVTWATFSRDGQRVLTASHDDTARIWDVRTGRPLIPPLKHADWVEFTQFSPDEKLVATASQDRTARVWDARTGEPVTPPLRHAREVTSAIFSPDGRRLLTASHDGTARMWDVRTGRPVGQLMRHANVVASARFSPDGRRVLTASWDHTAQLWDVRTGEPLGKPMRHGDSVNNALFSPDGSRIVTVSADETARVWDAETGKAQTDPIKHDEEVQRRSPAFSPDGRRVITVAKNTAQVWDIRTGALVIEPLTYFDRLYSARFSPDGTRIVTTSVDGTARLLDANTGLPVSEPLKHGAKVNNAEFSADGRWLVTSSDDGTARIWEVMPALVPVPSWLPELAEAVAGQRFNEQNMTETVPPAELFRLKDWLTHSNANDAGTRWAQWFLGDNAGRAMSPSSALTMQDYLQQRLLDGNPASLSETVRLAPTNAPALARFALHLLTNAPAGETNQVREAAWHSRRTLALAPHDPEVWWHRAEWLERSGDVAQAMEAMSRGAALDPRPPEFWNAYAVLLARSNRLEEALQSFSKGIELCAASTDTPASVKAKLFQGRSAVLNRLGRAAEAQADLVLAKGIPARDPACPPQLIDLTDLYNAALTEPWHNPSQLGCNLALLPQGRQKFGGIEFDVRGIVQLGSQAMPPSRAGYGREVRGIAPPAHWRRLHFLHSACNPAEAGTEIGALAIHYADGRTEQVPIIFGQDLADLHAEEESIATLTPARVAWTGTNAANRIVRLYQGAWVNPRPEAEVKSVEYSSAMTESAPFLIALTAEP